MALDFPSSPTNGQVYSNYYYDSTTGAWRANAPLAVGVPLGGTAGQILTKTTATDYDTSWQPGPGLMPIVPTSATTGTVDATGTVTFSAQTSISVNGCFTSTYTRYRMFADFTTSGMTGTDTSWVLRTSGTNNVTGAYGYNGYRFADWSALQLNGRGGTAFPFMASNTQAGTSYIQGYTDVMYPQQTGRTYMNHVGNLHGAINFDGSNYFAGIFDGTTSFDGFSIIFSASSTGTIKIYGYN